VRCAGPNPIPEPDVVRPPTPSEEPAPDVVVNIPEPLPTWNARPSQALFLRRRPLSLRRASIARLASGSRISDAKIWEDFGGLSFADHPRVQSWRLLPVATRRAHVKFSRTGKSHARRQIR
jgi:hypothetical protein